MSVLPRLLPAVAALLLCACSSGFYHMGGVKPDNMKDFNTYCVQMFENHSTQPSAGMLLTTALGDSLQRDGTYRLAPSGEADFAISGEITDISRYTLLTDPNDTYLSREVGISVHVRYTIKDLRNGKTVREGSVTGDSSYYTTTGNLQSALESALSYACRRAAEDMTTDLTMP